MSDAPHSILTELFSLLGKVALVTGASSGIGREIAIGLAAAGATVALSGRSREELQNTRCIIEKSRGKAASYPAELAEAAACRRLIADVSTTLGRLDVLVNCAGMNRRKPIDQVTEDDFQRIVDVNLRSVFILSQAVHPIMKRQGGGKIIHIVSLSSFIGLGGVSVYGITKAALVQLAKTQAVEWAKDNIQINCVAPGFTLTPLTETSLWNDEHKSQWMLDRIPARRPARPREMVAAALFLAGPGSSYVTGQTITVDGGVLAGGSWEKD